MRRKNLEFEAGNKIFLKVFSMKCILRIKRKGKLNSCFIRHFNIIDQIGLKTYKLVLPPSLFVVHNVFHISMLQKYLDDTTRAIGYESLQINDGLSYEKRPIRIFDWEVKVFCTRKMVLQSHQVEETT